MSDEQNPPSKRHRFFVAAASREQGTRVPNQASLDSFDKIPREAVQHILSFLTFTDRQAVTTTNKRGLREVEIFSKRLYMKIKEDHDVDQAFDDRVCDQTNITTKRVKPVFIPFRYRVTVSLKTRLYKIETDRFSIGRLLLSPSERRLAMLAENGDGSYTVIFDFSTKRLTTVEQYGNFDWLDDNHILLYDYCNGSPRILKEDAETTNWHSDIIPGMNLMPKEHVSFETGLSEGEVFAFIQTPSRLNSVTMNINDRSVKTNFFIDLHHSTWTGPLHFASDSDQKWFLFYCGETLDKEEGLHIYDRKTNQRSQFRPGKKLSLKQASDCSKTFFCQRDNSVVVLEFGRDGCLSERFSFPVTGYLLAASKKHVFVWSDISSMGKLCSYDVVTGLPNRKPFRPFNVAAPSAIIANTRQELLMWDSYGTVSAYCLEEPRM